MHTFAHLMFWLTGGFTFLVIYGFSRGILAAGVALAVTLLGCLIFFLFMKSGTQGLAVRCLKKLSALPLIGNAASRFLENKREMLENIDREIIAFRARKKDFFITLSIEYLTRLMEVVEFYLILILLEVDISYLACLVALACASLLGNLMFFVPMQVGSREAGLALALSWSGVASPFGVTASLLSRLREVFYIALGVAAMLIKGSGNPAGGSEPADEEKPAFTDESSDESETAAADEPASETTQPEESA